LHVTLAFLGGVDAERVAPLGDALRAAVAGVEPFDLRFDRLGGFPNRHRARIAWAGSERSDEVFAHVAHAVREAAREFAAIDEKPPALHVTLARLREPHAIPKVRFSPCTMRVAEIVLFESLPGDATSRYDVVERFPLTVHASSADHVT